MLTTARSDQVATWSLQRTAVRPNKYVTVSKLQGYSRHFVQVIYDRSDVGFRSIYCWLAMARTPLIANYYRHEHCWTNASCGPVSAMPQHVSRQSAGCLCTCMCVYVCSHYVCIVTTVQHDVIIYVQHGEKSSPQVLIIPSNIDWFLNTFHWQQSAANLQRTWAKWSM